ncbi:CDC5 [Hepatospora eriocheir]|uniref:CDC5 n=1 Tax=Hepatospora eriocheir TaxID=1081669 RepID=A0A1X0QB58_9MICR|nr:CDC5 [Hepatospora eriocheir]
MYNKNELGNKNKPSNSSKDNEFFSIGTVIKDNLSSFSYTIIGMLGRGAYAQCFKVTRSDQAYFALKVIRLANLKSSTVRDKLETEIQIQQSLDHPNIVKMYDSFRDNEHIFMVLELCGKGALDTLLNKYKKFKEKTVSIFTQQVLKGLLYLHNQKNIIHRDLKLGNLFLDEKYNIKIGDFGLSAFIPEGMKRKTLCGTPNYIAPEVLFDKKTGHSFEVDLWSLGVIIYTLLIGTPPFQKNTVEEIYKNIENNSYIFPNDHNLSSEAIDIIRKLLVLDPNERLSLEELLRHNFLHVKGENIAIQLYNNLLLNSYNNKPILDDHITYSFPLDILKGVGYICKSNLIGIYYHNNDNIYIKKGTLVYIRVKMVDNKKVFKKDEFLFSKLPTSLYPHLNNIKYFVKNFTNLNWDNLMLPEIKSDIYLVRVRRIENGLLFVMSNNVFIFDFVSGERVVISSNGLSINVLDDDGKFINFDTKTKENILNILRIFQSPNSIK